jgi:hypothetical protein
MGFQKKHVSGGSEDLDFFYRRVSREPPLKKLIGNMKRIHYLNTITVAPRYNEQPRVS